MKKYLSVFSVLIVSAVLAFTVMAGDGKTTTVNLNVKGMHCGGCANKVKAALTNISGVSEVQEVSVEKNSATVSYDPSKVSEEKIVAALVEKTGYTVSVNESAGKTKASEKSEAKCCAGKSKAECKASAKCSKAKAE